MRKTSTAAAPSGRRDHREPRSLNPSYADAIMRCLSMSQPYVTVAMPCRNEAGFIEACLRSVQAQSYPRERIEILVADGGSTDGTREILARLANRGRPHPLDRQPAADPGRRAQIHAIRASRGDGDRAHGRARRLRSRLPREVHRGAGPHRGRQRRRRRALPREGQRAAGRSAPRSTARSGSEARRFETQKRRATSTRCFPGPSGAASSTRSGSSTKERRPTRMPRSTSASSRPAAGSTRAARSTATTTRATA